MYAEDAYEASDLEKHDTLVTKEGEAVTVKHLHLSLSTSEVLACSRSGWEKVLQLHCLTQRTQVLQYMLLCIIIYIFVHI